MKPTTKHTLKTTINTIKKRRSLIASTPTFLFLSLSFPLFPALSLSFLSSSEEDKRMVIQSLLDDISNHHHNNACIALASLLESG